MRHGQRECLGKLGDGLQIFGPSHGAEGQFAAVSEKQFLIINITDISCCPAEVPDTVYTI